MTSVMSLDPDAHDPSHWGSIVESLHNNRFDLDSDSEPDCTATRSHFLRIFCDVDKPTLKKLWRAGFDLCVARCVVDVYFCGFSKDFLTSPAGQELHVHVRFISDPSTQ